MVRQQFLISSSLVITGEQDQIVNLTEGNDTYTAGNLGEIINALGGNDNVTGGLGNDTMNGGDRKRLPDRRPETT